MLQMNVRLLENMHTVNDDEMPNWVSLSKIIEQKNPLNLELSQTHNSVKAKIAFADYHYHILNQFYVPHATLRQTDTNQWVLAEIHSVITSLYSALDSLMYEVNLAYNFWLNISQINIHHQHTKASNDCIRCRIDNVNDNLTTYLNHELSQDWFNIFRKLRNQITHKNIPILNIAVNDTTHIMIPNDPTNTNPQYSDYSKGLEINTLCQEYRNNIIPIIEKTYKIIHDRIVAL